MARPDCVEQRLNEYLVGHDDGLDPIGDSPQDPLLPRARAIIERHGGTVEQLGAQREGVWRHATIHAKATLAGPHDRRVRLRRERPRRAR
jgi:hypothetical protein